MLPSWLGGPTQLLMLPLLSRTMGLIIILPKTKQIEFGEMAKCPFSPGQMINIAYNIINKTKRFKDGIVIAWNQKPLLDKKWINFKCHFRVAQDELAETGELTMGTAGYY